MKCMIFVLPTVPGTLEDRRFGQTEAEAVALFRDTNYLGFKEYLSGFGFGEAFRTTED